MVHTQQAMQDDFYLNFWFHSKPCGYLHQKSFPTQISKSNYRSDYPYWRFNKTAKSMKISDNYNLSQPENFSCWIPLKSTFSLSIIVKFAHLVLFFSCGIYYRTLLKETEIHLKMTNLEMSKTAGYPMYVTSDGLIEASWCFYMNLFSQF